VPIGLPLYCRIFHRTCNPAQIGQSLGRTNQAPLPRLDSCRATFLSPRRPARSQCMRPAPSAQRQEGAATGTPCPRKGPGWQIRYTPMQTLKGPLTVAARHQALFPCARSKCAHLIPPPSRPQAVRPHFSATCRKPPQPGELPVADPGLAHLPSVHSFVRGVRRLFLQPVRPIEPGRGVPLSPMGPARPCFRSGIRRNPFGGMFAAPHQPCAAVALDEGIGLFRAPAARRID
jgi:hypothetical protein